MRGRGEVDEEGIGPERSGINYHVNLGQVKWGS